MKDELLFGKPEEKPEEKSRIIQIGNYKLAIPENTEHGLPLILLTALIELDDPKVNEVLLKCGVVFPDFNGNIYFPKKNTKLNREKKEDVGD